MILFVMRKVCEEMIENYRNLNVRMYCYMNMLGLLKSMFEFLNNNICYSDSFSSI
jgi:hypothetical protein